MKDDTISRQAVQEMVDRIGGMHPYRQIGNRDSYSQYNEAWTDAICRVDAELNSIPSAQPERKWTPCSNPPKHHKDVLVRGIEAIGNVTVHKVMQWDVDTWRPTDYAPSITWKEWSEI